ncbi:MAG: hypothetical protein QOD77_1933 [Thermoplasmata archaeon]|jgi:hypothetical protein|nr:hypothetical protein [Thermoplasmata archaeon]
MEPRGVLAAMMRELARPGLLATLARRGVRRRAYHALRAAGLRRRAAKRLVRQCARGARRLRGRWDDVAAEAVLDAVGA